jgi:hypothetical protein
MEEQVAQAVQVLAAMAIMGQQLLVLELQIVVVAEAVLVINRPLLVLLAATVVQA